ncbi:uncharacterized protein LOC132702507 [Cylas formicarius]|uniref:uncharacterized protein LOC132702507 n=1 Tax=Cylas formicarius TaxID=197179 RepID=UPI00295877DA|nr:uncharacterized protein LOC132702507 [Cylas formicarius]
MNLANLTSLVCAIVLLPRSESQEREEIASLRKVRDVAASVTIPKLISIYNLERHFIDAISGVRCPYLNRLYRKTKKKRTSKKMLESVIYKSLYFYIRIFESLDEFRLKSNVTFNMTERSLAIKGIGNVVTMAESDFYEILASRGRPPKWLNRFENRKVNRTTCVQTTGDLAYMSSVDLGFLSRNLMKFLNRCIKLLRGFKRDRLLSKQINII